MRERSVRDRAPGQKIRMHPKFRAGRFTFCMRRREVARQPPRPPSGACPISNMPRAARVTVSRDRDSAAAHTPSALHAHTDQQRAPCRAAGPRAMVSAFALTHSKSLPEVPHSTWSASRSGTTQRRVADLQQRWDAGMAVIHEATSDAKKPKVPLAKQIAELEAAKAAAAAANGGARSRVAHVS